MTIFLGYIMLWLVMIGIGQAILRNTKSGLGRAIVVLIFHVGGAYPLVRLLVFGT